MNVKLELLGCCRGSALGLDFNASTPARLIKTWFRVHQSTRLTWDNLRESLVLGTGQVHIKIFSLVPFTTFMHCPIFGFYP